MADLTMISFRPRNEMLEDFEMLQAWCRVNKITFSSVINAFLPAITYAVQNNLKEDLKSGNTYVTADFGDVLLVSKTQRGGYYCRKDYKKVYAQAKKRD